MTGCVGCGSAFGSGGVGSAPFGSGSVSSFVSAVQVAMNAVDVTFSSPPSMSDRANVTDALFPANWTLSVVGPSPVTVRISQFVERRDAVTARVFFDGPLQVGWTFGIELNPRVVDAYGIPFASCCEIEVGPCYAEALASTATSVPTVAVDLSNPFVARDAPLGAAGPLGTYSATSTGDIANESGRAYLRKRVLRRATTVSGAFFHLPGYGFGQPLKTTIRADMLRQLQSKARAQILLEPDVFACEVVASFVGSSTFAIRLAIRVSDSDGNVEDLETVVGFRAS